MYRNYTILNGFFASFEKQTDKNFRIYVADLSDEKKDYPYPPFATLIPGDNKGYAHGVNIDIKKAVADKAAQFAVINNDVEVAPDFVAATKKSIIDHPASLIGGKIYYGAGYEYHQDRYAKADLGHVIWYAGGICDWKNAVTMHRGVDEVDKGQFDKLEPTEFITGCLTCFDAGVIDKIGLWDESYFMYYEDADYCERAKRHGVPLFYDPSIVIWHKNAASTGGSGSSLHTKYQRKNHVIFGLRYAPLRTKIHLVKNFLVDRKRI